MLSCCNFHHHLSTVVCEYQIGAAEEDIQRNSLETWVRNPPCLFLSGLNHCWRISMKIWAFCNTRCHTLQRDTELCYCPLLSRASLSTCLDWGLLSTPNGTRGKGSQQNWSRNQALVHNGLLNSFFQRVLRNCTDVLHSFTLSMPTCVSVLNIVLPCLVVWPRYF